MLAHLSILIDHVTKLGFPFNWKKSTLELYIPPIQLLWEQGSQNQTGFSEQRTTADNMGNMVAAHSVVHHLLLMRRLWRWFRILRLDSIRPSQVWVWMPTSLSKDIEYWKDKWVIQAETKCSCLLFIITMGKRGCIACALSEYCLIQHTRGFRKSQPFWVCYGGPSPGTALSKQRLAHWVTGAVKRLHSTSHNLWYPSCVWAFA